MGSMSLGEAVPPPLLLSSEDMPAPIPSGIENESAWCWKGFCMTYFIYAVNWQSQTPSWSYIELAINSHCSKQGTDVVIIRGRKPFLVF